MLVYCCLYFLSFVVFPVRPVQAANSYGTGFYLSADHGTVSIHFPNGTSVDIAKIPGSIDYRQAMRTAYGPPSTSILLKYPSRTLNYSDAAVKEAILHPEPDYGRWRLPTWPLWKTNPDTPLTPILRELKMAVEAYLHESVTWVTVYLPFRQNLRYLGTLTGAFEKLGMQTPRLEHGPAGIETWLAYRDVSRDGDAECVFDTDIEEFILTIEYNRESFMGTVYAKECSCPDPALEEGGEQCFYPSRQHLFATFLGSDVVASAGALGVERLESAIQMLIRSSLGTEWWAEMRKADMQRWTPWRLGVTPYLNYPKLEGQMAERIDRVLLLGDAAEDKVFKEALVKVLGEMYGPVDAETLVDDAYSRQLRGGTGVLDAVKGDGHYVFAASRVAARECCQWRDSGERWR